MSRAVARTPDLPRWVGEIDRIQVDLSRLSLTRALEKRFDGDSEAKISFLTNLKHQVEEGSETLTKVQAVALTEVLSDLTLNRKIVERKGI